MPQSGTLLEDYTPEREFAAEIGKALITLRVWRAQKKGPPYTRIGRQIFYHRPSAQIWLKSGVTFPQHSK